MRGLVGDANMRDLHTDTQTDTRIHHFIVKDTVSSKNTIRKIREFLSKTDGQTDRPLKTKISNLKMNELHWTSFILQV